MNIGISSAVEAGKEAQYIVTAKAVISNINTIVKVENGIPQYGNSLDDKWVYYYLKTSNSTPVYAVVSPSSGNPNLYATILTDLSLKESEWNVPTLETYLKKSEDSIGADILLLTEKDLKNCSSSCVVIFGVLSGKEGSNFTFTATRGVRLLGDNSPYTDSVRSNGGYNFYDYYRSCSECTTIISISTFIQNAYKVYANFNTTERFSKHDNTNTADFSFSSMNTGELVISSDDLKRKGYQDSPGYFFIEVTSSLPFNYTITVVSSTSKAKLFPLNKGVSASYSTVDGNMYQYFAYNHDSQNGFVIQMQEDYGFVELLVNTIEDSSTNTTEKLPIDQSHSKWTTFNQSLRGELEINSKDKNF